MADFEFRKLKAEDMFPMFQLLSKIGLKEIKESLDPEMVGKLVKSFSDTDTDNENTENTENTEDVAYSVGISIVVDIANIVMSHLPSCKKEIYTLLANVSGMKVNDIANLDIATFTEMVIAFVQKDEFKDFIGVVSKSFK